MKQKFIPNVIDLSDKVVKTQKCRECLRGATRARLELALSILNQPIKRELTHPILLLSWSSDHLLTRPSSTGPSKRNGSLPLSIQGHSSENAIERIAPPEPRIESWICTSWPGLAIAMNEPMRLLVNPTARINPVLSSGCSSSPTTRYDLIPLLTN